MALAARPLTIGFTGPDGQEDMPYLLTPGPLTTSRGVKLAMLADWGSRDVEFRRLVRDIRTSLCAMARAGEDFTCVLMQGSGTFAIEAVLGGFAPTGRKRKTLVVINGAYGKRAAKILEHLKRPCVQLAISDSAAPDAAMVQKALAGDDQITTVFVVHCETTSGIINPVQDIVRVCKDAGKVVIVDAMSSFGALELDMDRWGIDVMVSSSNKCIEGVPGFSYAICRTELLEETKGRCHSVVLDLYEQWRGLETNGQFRFTPPTHALVAFHQALKEHKLEGGVTARGDRYDRNAQGLLKAMRKLGFVTLLDDAVAGPVIQTFLSPADGHFEFEAFYQGLRARGYAIYPGKLTEQPSFRIGTIGQLDEKVMTGVAGAIVEVLKDMGVRNFGPAD